MNVRIGINPLTWSNDDLPTLGADIDLDTCLRQAAEAGYAGVELGHKFPRSASVLAPLLSGHGLDLVSGWWGLRLLERDVDAELEAMRPHLELLRALGSRVVVCAEVTEAIHGERHVRLSQRPQLSSVRYDAFAGRLAALARRMRELGMRLAYHHHMGTVVQTPAEIDRLLTAPPPEVELLLDTGHLVFAQGHPVETATRHGRRIAHVHCKDVRADVLRRCLNADTSFLDAVLMGVFTVPGDGTIEWGAVLPPLEAVGYRGWLVVEAEQDPTVADPYRMATTGFGTLSRLISGP